MFIAPNIKTVYVFFVAILFILIKAIHACKKDTAASMQMELAVLAFLLSPLIMVLA
jgi:hypothetical protein